MGISAFTKVLNRLLIVLRQDTAGPTSVTETLELMVEAEEKCLLLMCKLSKMYSENRDYTSMLEVSHEMKCVQQESKDTQTCAQ